MGYAYICNATDLWICVSGFEIILQMLSVYGMHNEITIPQRIIFCFNVVVALDSINTAK